MGAQEEYIITDIQLGDSVKWKWATGFAYGQVIDITPETVTIVSKGKKITRHGTVDNPAVTIENDSGTHILKLESELIL